MLAQLPAATIRDTVAAVFRDPDFNRFSLMDRILAWVWDVLQVILARMGQGRVPEHLFWLVVIVIGLILLLFMTRAFFPQLLRRSRARRTGLLEQTGLSGQHGDAWAAARGYAARGDYTAAAHALYAALLDFIARRGDVELHEAKTIGDYLRELAQRSSGMRAQFREFARSYEVVIYGLGSCDRDRYERLFGLANRVVQSGG
jgi:hypothetical protein